MTQIISELSQICSLKSTRTTDVGAMVLSKMATSGNVALHWPTARTKHRVFYICISTPVGVRGPSETLPSWGSHPVQHRRWLAPSGPSRSWCCHLQAWRGSAPSGPSARCGPGWCQVLDNIHHKNRRRWLSWPNDSFICSRQESKRDLIDYLIDYLTIHRRDISELDQNQMCLYLPVEGALLQSDLALSSLQTFQVGRTVNRCTAAQRKDPGGLACSPASPWREIPWDQYFTNTWMKVV